MASRSDDGEGSLSRSAALSQKAALPMITPSVIACGDATFPKGTAFSGSDKVSGSAQRLPLGGAGALAPEGVTPPRENGIAERLQTLRYSEIINILSAIYAQSNAARILNRPALGGVHHKIRAFGNAVLRKIPLLQRHPPGGKIRVACALPRL